jgi:myo-inositol-1(or 4)-monophosphatase
MTKHKRDLERIVQALEASAAIYRSRPADTIRVNEKAGGDPVTDVELAVNRLLFETLVSPGDGWLSEESADNSDRLTQSRVWLIDPLDGTKEYIAGVPECCVSIALLDEGRLVAAGVLNPCTGEMFCGCADPGVTASNNQTKAIGSEGLDDSSPLVLASRSEVNRGEWRRFHDAEFRVQPVGSVAYKLALVAAGRADATWTLVPKHEWDVAAGAALVQFSRGIVLRTDGQSPVFSQRDPILPGLVAFSASGLEKLRPFLCRALKDPALDDCQPWARILVDRTRMANPEGG